MLASPVAHRTARHVREAEGVRNAARASFVSTAWYAHRMSPCACLRSVACSEFSPRGAPRLERTARRTRNNARERERHRARRNARTAQIVPILGPTATHFMHRHMAMRHARTHTRRGSVRSAPHAPRAGTRQARSRGPALALKEAAEVSPFCQYAPRMNLTVDGMPVITGAGADAAARFARDSRTSGCWLFRVKPPCRPWIFSA